MHSADPLEVAVAQNEKIQDHQSDFTILTSMLAQELEFLGQQSPVDTDSWWIVDDYYGFKRISIYLNPHLGPAFERIRDVVIKCLHRYPSWTVEIQFYQTTSIEVKCQMMSITTTSTMLSYDQN